MKFFENFVGVTLEVYPQRQSFRSLRQSIDTLRSKIELVVKSYSNFDIFGGAP